MSYARLPGKEDDEKKKAKTEELKPWWQSSTTRHRIFRITILILILIAIIPVPVPVIIGNVAKKAYSVTTDRPLIFVLTNCMLYIGEDSMLGAGDIYLNTNVPGILHSIV